MSILIVDEKTFKVTVKSNVNEKFIPDEKVLKINEEAKSIFNEKNRLNMRLTKLLNECHEWNRKNDENYEKMIQEKIKKQREVSKK